MYWFAATGLVVFGFLGLLTIGAPFLLFGLVMMLLSPWRNRKDVIVPALAAVVAFVIAYLLLVPISCEAASGLDPITSCRYLVGVRWMRSGTGQPSLVPGVIGGIVLATFIALVSRRLLRKSASVA